MTCAVATTQAGDTPRDLFSLVDEAKKNAGQEFNAILADSGFADYTTLTAMEENRDETFYVPDKRCEITESGETA